MSTVGIHVQQSTIGLKAAENPSLGVFATKHVILIFIAYYTFRNKLYHVGNVLNSTGSRLGYYFAVLFESTVITLGYCDS